MYFKAILMLLAAVLLFQGYNAAPYRDEDSALHALVERLKLLKFTEAEVYPINKEIISKGKLFMEKVLKDPKVLGIETAEMKSNLDEIRSFVEGYDKFEKSDASAKELYKLVEKYEILKDKYDKNVEDTQEAKIIAKSLKENGYERLGKSTETSLKEFVDKFIVELQKCIDGMNETEKKEDPKMLALMKELKAESDIEKQDELIWKFFGWISLEDFLW